MTASLEKSVGIFAFTNDIASLDTGVTQYNQDLILQLCQSFPEIKFTIYLSKENSKRFSHIRAKNLEKVILNTLVYEPPNLVNTIGKVITTYLPIFKTFSEYEYFKSAEKHDLYIYTVFGTSQWFPYFIKKIINASCISVIHDIRFLKKKHSTLKEKILQYYQIKVFRKLCQSSTALLIPSNDAIMTLSKLLFVAEDKCYKSFSVPVDARWHRTQKNLICTTIPDSYFFFPATIVDTKNHIFLVEIFSLYNKLFPNTKLLFSGSNTKSSLWMRISRRVGELGLQSSVIHLGFVSDELKNELFKNAIAAIFPTERESFNLAIWEAFQNGCPVINSDDPELIEQVADATLVGNLGNKDSFLNHMIELTENQALRTQLAHAGRARLSDCAENSLLSGWEKMLITIEDR